MPAASPIRKLIRTLVPRAEAVRLDKAGVDLKLTPMERRWVAHYVSSPRPERNAREAARLAGSRAPEDYAKDIVKSERVLKYLEVFEAALVGRVVESSTLEETEGAIATADQVRRHATAGMEASWMGLYVKPNGAVDVEAIRKAPAGAITEFEVVAGPENGGTLEAECHCGKVVRLPARVRFKLGNHHAYTALNGRFLGLDKGRVRGRPKTPQVTNDNSINLNLSLLPVEIAIPLMAWVKQQQELAALPPAPGTTA